MKIKLLSFVLVLLLTACDRNQHQFQGYVEAHNILLSSPYAGKLMDLSVDRGDFVEQLAVLFKLDSNPEAFEMHQADFLVLEGQYGLQDLQSPRREPEVKAAMAQIEQVNARLRLGELREKRYKQLYEKKAGNLDTSDEARERLVELHALKKQREAELDLAKMGARKYQIESKKERIKALLERSELAKWQLAQKTGYAPTSGIIFDTYYKQGEWVPAGSPVVALLAPENIKIDFYVPVSILPKLHTKQTLYFTCDGCATKNKAVIDYISPEAEYVPPLVYSRNNYDKLVYRIKATPEKPGLFKPGQPVTITGFKYDK